MNTKDCGKIILFFSGGKDSLACLLHLIEIGTDMSKVELWHHEVDGREGSALMDWPVTPSYCKAVAKAFNLPIYFSWKVGGFEREMLRNGARTAPTKFETPTGIKQIGGTRGKINTRLKFPQVSADLRVRWCSAYLKIDVATSALKNQDRFKHSKTLVISGERAEESPGRAKYKQFEPGRADLRGGKAQRHIVHWRPVHQWTEEKVWAIIERFKVNPHPAYWLGWGRVSCMYCIFGSDNQWASGRQVCRTGFNKIADYEQRFGLTIHRSKTVGERARNGVPYQMSKKMVDMAMSKEFYEPIFMLHWLLPPGAFGESCGPV